MNQDNIEFWKGSSGYSAPGAKGVDGEVGKSAHFSAYSYNKDASTMYQFISNGRTLSNNPKVKRDEQYVTGDTILDCDGLILIIKSIDPVVLQSVGNIVDFNSVNESDEDEYRTPVNDSSIAQIDFYWELKSTELGNTTNHPLIYNYREGGANDNENGYRETPLWHTRHYRKERDRLCPLVCLVPDDVQGGSLYTYDGSLLYANPEEFVDEIVESGEYCCCKAILPSGIVIENVGGTLSFDWNYIHMIDSSITNINNFTSYASELGEGTVDNTFNNNYLPLLQGTDPKIKLYFEYSHEGKIYRMKINITRFVGQ